MHVRAIISYTTYNEQYFQKVSFYVIMHPIGQNSRVVCKKHGNHGDARGAKHLTLALGMAGWPTVNHTSSASDPSIASTALGLAGPRPRLQYSYLAIA